MNPTSATGEAVVNLPFGSVVAGEFAFVVKPMNYKANGNQRGFIYCPGKAAGGYNVVGAGFVYELARRGYPVICGDFGDTPTAIGKNDGPGVWGNDAAVTKLGTYKTFLQTQLGAKAGKIGLLYGSHGCALAYAYAAANPTQVQMIAGAIGTCDVEDIRANNRASHQASIETAYTNNAGWQAARPTHNPVEVAATLTIPQLDYYSTDDPTCTAATHAAFAAAAGSNMTQRSMGAVGHTFGATTFFPRSAAMVGAFADWCEDRAA